MILRYGNGNIIWDSDTPASSIIIKFRGNPYLMLNDKTIKIEKENNTITFMGNLEDNFCRYFGYLKILNCITDDIKTTVKTINIHLPELMEEFPEDITTFPEDLKNGYTHVRKFKGYQFKKQKKIAGKKQVERKIITGSGGGY